MREQHGVITASFGKSKQIEHVSLDTFSIRSFSAFNFVSDIFILVCKFNIASSFARGLAYVSNSLKLNNLFNLSNNIHNILNINDILYDKKIFYEYDEIIKKISDKLMNNSTILVSDNFIILNI
jgi:hypothetical protein